MEYKQLIGQQPAQLALCGQSLKPCTLLPASILAGTTMLVAGHRHDPVHECYHGARKPGRQGTCSLCSMEGWKSIGGYNLPSQAAINDATTLFLASMSTRHTRSSRWSRFAGRFVVAASVQLTELWQGWAVKKKFEDVSTQLCSSQLF